MTDRLSKLRPRHSFANRKPLLAMPGLLAGIGESWDSLLQANTPPAQRKPSGLQAAFTSLFPVVAKNGGARLEFVSYSLAAPRLDTEECRRRGETFESPLSAQLRLVILDEAGGPIEVREQNVKLGAIPLMTPAGSFIANGTERAIVSQLHRSPGLYLSQEAGDAAKGSKLVRSARIIPHRGSWIDFEADAKDRVFLRIDRKRRMPATILLQAIGMTRSEILHKFHEAEALSITATGLSFKPDAKRLTGMTPTYDIYSAQGEVLAPRGRRINSKLAKSMADLDAVHIPEEAAFGMILADDIIDSSTGEILSESNTELGSAIFEKLRSNGIVDVRCLRLNDTDRHPHISGTLRLDECSGQEAARIMIFRSIRPGEPPTEGAVKTLFDGLFFDPARYDLSAVGRKQLDSRLGRQTPGTPLTLTRDDIVDSVKALADLIDGLGRSDDIDHLSNRRVRSPGEIAGNIFSAALSKTLRQAQEKLNIAASEKLMPADLTSGKGIIAAFREFLGSGTLCQFIDQTNPLSEISHKRRISALGPGGLTRERAGFEARDVHPTHYGRLCPIESPEGQNIGLIASMALHARLDDYGFLETPYAVIRDGALTGEIQWLNAASEENAIIANAGAVVDSTGRITEALSGCRAKGEFTLEPPERITHMDVGSEQPVSLAASLIPFLEHDDANRALMGANMQRQAVPCLRPEKPLVGTGMERQAAADSECTVKARRNGVVEFVDAQRIVIRASADSIEDGDLGVDLYSLGSRTRSNQGTSIQQRPAVRVGDIVRTGDTIADGAATDKGELALGQNLVVAFMPWRGYNFEDSILISERVVEADRYTSIHLEEFSVTARDTKLGPEEITVDIPGLGAAATAELDENGIIRVGARVEEGSVLVGRTTPKGESQLTAEEKLLHAIFGSKAAEVKDASLRVPSGIEGTVIDVQVLNAPGIEPCSRSVALAKETAASLRTAAHEQIRAIEGDAVRRLVESLSTAAANGCSIKKGGKKISTQDIAGLSLHELAALSVGDDEIARQIETAVAAMEQVKSKIEANTVNKIAAYSEPAELGAGALKTVKVTVAVKRRLQPGDKMAGRHGNKGVVSKILPVEDMPHLPDGTPVDIVLNPLGVPSRMNIGQILETHLGWACKGLGQAIASHMASGDLKAVRTLLDSIYEGDDAAAIRVLSDDELRDVASNLAAGVPVATPVFSGASEANIKKWLALAGLPESGQTELFDGVTGEKFKRPVTVGVMHVLKLHHLVDEKMHARSTGPYSMVTQQPIGGRARNGGQRLGEMEVWALEAYGAAHILQEMLTVKSDDVPGRTQAYHSIVSGKEDIQAGIPESFNVLQSEIRALGIDLSTIKK